MRVPIGNHTKHDVTLPSKTALQSIESVVKVVQTDEPDPATPSVTQVADGDGYSRRQLDKDDERGSVVEQWDPPVDIIHLSEDQQKNKKLVLEEVD